MDMKTIKHEEGHCDEDGITICRDFLRNVCHRGRRCKFKHPSIEELEELVDVSSNGISYEFCHDFQNNQCQRSSCRFVHCTKEEEENYMITKRLPRRVKYQYEFGIGDCFLGQDKNIYENNISETNGRPICRDYLNHDCHRGKKCRFVHVDPQQIAMLAAEAEKGLEIHQEGGIKRPRMIVDGVEACSETSEYCNLRSNHAVVNCLPNLKLLEEENQSLKKRIQELEKQVSDLAATNEVLLEQNAQFRLEKRGITTYGHSLDGVAPPSFTPSVGLNSPATVVFSSAPRPMPVQLNVQVTGQPPVPEMTEYITPSGQEMLGAGQGPPRAVVAPTPLHQGSVSVPQTSDMAQVIAVNSGGNVEVIPGTNQVLPPMAGPIPQGTPRLAQPQLNQLAQQPIVSFSAPGQAGHNQMVQQQSMASFAAAMPGPNQIAPQQQPVSFGGPIMAAAIGGGRCALQAATVTGEIRQSNIGSMGPAVPLPQPTLVYTVTRTTDNMPLVSTIVPVTAHEMTLVADRSRNPVSSMTATMHVPAHGGQQGFSSVSPATQAMVQTPSHQNNEIVSALPCAPMTSGIGGASKQMSPSVSRGAVHPVVQNNHVPQSPRVKGGQRGVVQGASSLSDPSMITYPINAVAQAQLHN